MLLPVVKMASPLPFVIYPSAIFYFINDIRCRIPCSPTFSSFLEIHSRDLHQQLVLPAHLRS